MDIPETIDITEDPLLIPVSAGAMSLSLDGGWQWFRFRSRAHFDAWREALDRQAMPGRDLTRDELTERRAEHHLEQQR